MTSRRIRLAQAAHERRAVAKATPNQRTRMAVTLAQAFFNDPVFSWVLHDDPLRLPALDRYFDLALRKLWVPQEECYTTPEVAGVAVC